MTDSQRLLANYVRDGSEAAFRELVIRFVHLVYSTALRLVEGDTHRAEDVTQTVFVNLARKARTLPGDVRLGSWLHRDTCLVAGHTLRGERRRQSHERQAAEMNALQNQSEADFSQVAPLLDEAINELGDADRTAILLRFFEQQAFRAVGQALGSNEDAARMRVSRALAKLEEFLKRRGVTTTAASLGVVLAANAVQAAPVGLAVTISTAAALAGTTLATTATATVIKAIAMTTLQKALITATIVATVGTGIYEARQASSLREQNQVLHQQQSALTAQIQQLIRQRDEVSNRLATLRDENDRLNRIPSELLKLRGEVGILKRQLAEAAQTRIQSEVRPPSTGQPNDPLEQQKRKAGVIAMDAHVYLSAFMEFAEQSNGQYPTNWNQIRDKYTKSQDLTGTNSFEIIAHPSLNANDMETNPAAVAMIREFQAWPTVDGKWAKVYGFADGHTETVILPDGNFGAWEQQHTFNPASAQK
jgi:RNA polymerase sigma factor (sigma-70 family)